MARGRRSSHRSKVFKDQVWASVHANEFQVATGIQATFDIVTAFDWAGQGGERGTLMTIRGWLSICAQNDTGVKSEGQVSWYIGVVNQGVTAPNIPSPNASTTYTATSILDTGGHIFESIAGGVGGDRLTRDWDINVKTMRRLRSQDDVLLVIDNGTGDDIRVGATLRALMRRAG